MAPPTVNTSGTDKFDLPTPESPSTRRKPYSFATLCATVDNPAQKDQYGSSSVPIYQTATFKGVGGEYDYTRSGNPTRSHLEHHLAKISSAGHAFAVSSGMAALDVITRILKPGDEVVAGNDIYGGTHRLLTYLKSDAGVIVHHVDTTDTKSLNSVINSKTSMVLLESPTNPLLQIADLETIASDVHERAPEALVVVDNTMMSPYLQRPLEHGADIVYDSATKYLSGHHDLMAGVITCNRDDVAKRITFFVNAVGNGLTPFDSFLLLRGTKTLAVRMDRQQSSAKLVARYLQNLGFHVFYPGLESHPGREIHERIADGPGAVLSFTTGDKSLSERIVGATRLWGISVSFGCVNSLISMPCVMSHASIDPATRASRGLPEDLIRLCVGIEDPEDLINDLEHALFEAGAIHMNRLGEDKSFVREQATISRAVEKLAFNAAQSDVAESIFHEREWLISAPGKVILFGEHAVVHGVTAIAASVDLRCYGLSSPRFDGKISLVLPDLNDFHYEWDIQRDLPWSAASPIKLGDAHPAHLDDTLVDAITKKLSAPVTESRAIKGACIAFLYLYMKLASSERPALAFTARSTLPIGAGLGSSASYSACVASALLLLYKRLSIPPLPAPSRGPAGEDPGHVHLSHEGRRAVPQDFAEEVNRWAFVAEKVLHGNPSGVDNSVAVFGGALAFTRPGFGKKSGMEQIQGFRSLKFLLTDSKVPRDTKSLVAGVGKKKDQEPELVNRILDAIQHISDEARRALADTELSRPAVLTLLESLIEENHAYLRTLGVSHESLEMIKTKTKSDPYNLTTKLTGAGGGGCAVTLIPDDFLATRLDDLVEELREAAFVPYLTSVGGSGLGILSPYGPNHAHPATPPETPNDLSLEEPVDTHLTAASEPFRKLFEHKSSGDLAGWLNNQRRWLYV